MEETFGRYGTAQELADKIDWEGGAFSFFGGYASIEEFAGTSIYEAVKGFDIACRKLFMALREAGVVLEEFDEEL